MSSMEAPLRAAARDRVKMRSCEMTSRGWSRLVGDQERRAKGEGHRHQHTLADPSAELMRVVVGAGRSIRTSASSLACGRAPPGDRARRARPAPPRSAGPRDTRVERVHPLMGHQRDVAPAMRRMAASEARRGLGRADGWLPPRCARCREYPHDGAADGVLPQPDSPTQPTVSPADLEGDTVYSGMVPSAVRYSTRRPSISSKTVGHRARSRGFGHFLEGAAHEVEAVTTVMMHSPGGTNHHTR